MHWAYFLTDIIVGVLIIAFYLLVNRKQNATVRTLEKTISALKTQLEVFDPKKFTEMQDLFDKYRDIKSKVETADKAQKIAIEGMRLSENRMLKCWNELLSFMYHVILKSMTEDQQTDLINKLPHNKEVFLAYKKEESKDAPQ